MLYWHHSEQHEGNAYEKEIKSEGFSHSSGGCGNLYVLGKLAAMSAEGADGWGFLLLYGAEIGVLGVYAVLWQQVIRKVELSVAYANRAVALLWSLLWAVFLFGEKITGAQLLGIALVIIGTAVINGGKEEA